MMENNYINSLFEFLKAPLDSGDEIFKRFAELPEAIVGKGDEPLQRFVYIPGKRKDRVLLVAHIDTVWDRAYNHTFFGEREVIFEHGIFRSATPECGIGADCRAGCAMLWELKDSGHSILLTDGEEHGKHGAKFLRENYKKLFNELNRHRYIIELDWKGTNCCLFNQVENTKRFKRYIADTFGFVDSEVPGGTDLQFLCKFVCGVNFGIGYHRWHTNKEVLVLSEWENTLNKLKECLEKPQPRFSSDIFAPYIRFAKNIVKKVLRKLKLKKK